MWKHTLHKVPYFMFNNIVTRIIILTRTWNLCNRLANNWKSILNTSSSSYQSLLHSWKFVWLIFFILFNVCEKFQIEDAQISVKIKILKKSRSTDNLQFYLSCFLLLCLKLYTFNIFVILSRYALVSIPTWNDLMLFAILGTRAWNRF